jgi:hypothetical protein
MIFFLASLLSWLCGFFAILVTAFFTYDYFSIIDITSFGILSFMGVAITIPVLYLPMVKWLKKKISLKQQFIYFPVAVMLIANIPLYVITWMNTPVNCGTTEAILFTTGFATTAIVFGLAMAYRENVSLKGSK